MRGRHWGVLEPMSPFSAASVTHSGHGLWEARLNGRRWRSSEQAADPDSHFHFLSVGVGPDMTGHSTLCSEWVNNYPPFILAELLPHRPILSLLPCQVSWTPNAATVLHSALCPFPRPARDFFSSLSPFFPFTLLQPKKEVTSQWSYFQVGCEFGI